MIIRTGFKAQTTAAQQTTLPAQADARASQAPATLASTSPLTRNGDIFLSGARRHAAETAEASPFDTSEYFLMLGGSVTLALGAKGPSVEVLQRALMLVAEKTGLEALSLPTGGADGTYGMEVAAAVRALQTRVGLEPTGSFGAAEAAQLMVLLSEGGPRSPGTGAPRGVRGLEALEAQLGLGELLESEQDPASGCEVRLYEQGRVELLPETGIPARVDLDGVRLPGAVVMRAMENGLGAFQRVHSDGFAQLNFEFANGTVTSAGGRVLEASLPSEGPVAVAEALGLGGSLGRGPSLNGHSQSFERGELIYDNASHVLVGAYVGTESGSVELSSAVLEVALFRELGAFESSATETRNGEGAFARYQFSRGAVVVDASGQICDVQVRRNLPASS